MAVTASQHSLDANDQNPVSGAGAVYVYQRLAGTWTNVQKIVDTGPQGRKASDALGGAYYTNNAGGMVAISGTTIFTTAIQHTYDGSGNILGASPGAVMVYDKVGSSWTLTQEILPKDPNGNIALRTMKFGTTICVANDILVISASGENMDANAANQVYAAGAVFVFKKSNGSWTQTQKLTASGAYARQVEDLFGGHMSFDGEWLAVSAVGHDYDSVGENQMDGAGATYLYQLVDGNFVYKKKLTAPVGERAAQGYWGHPLINKGTLVISAQENQTFVDGSNGEYRMGAVMIYELVNGQWTYKQKLVASSPTDRLLMSHDATMAISGDILAVGAPSYGTTPGRVLIFAKENGSWVEKQSITGPTSGFAYARRSLVIQGDELFVGHPRHLGQSDTVVHQPSVKIYK